MFIRSAHGLRAFLCCIPLLVAGCGGLQEVWEGPGAKKFRPQAIADGVVVGSAIVKQIAAGQQQQGMIARVSGFVQTLKLAMARPSP